MSEAAPLLQQVHDQFDTYDRYPYTDHSVISNIAITDRSMGYRVTTYPGGCGYGFDGFAIDLRTPNGMLSGDTPIRVETSRDYGGLMVLHVEEQAQDRDGLVTAHGTIDKPVACEGLTLPGDPGFELFAALHDQIQNLQTPLQDVVEVAGVNMYPISFDFKESTGSFSYDRDTKKVTHQRSTSYIVRDKDTSIEVNLDATVQTEVREEPNDIVVYRSGAIKHEGKEVMLDFDALLAFAGLHSTIRQLYA
jgi:hypothetical protein